MDSETSTTVRSIAAILDEIATRSPQAAALLNPGMNAVDVKAALQAAGFKSNPPTELLQAYAWRNGCGTGDSCEPPFFHYHIFLPIERAIDEWKICVEENRRAGENIYSESLLPIFYFEGEFYGVECSESPSEHGQIHFIFHDDTLAYDSLGAMLESISECYRNGGYTGKEDDIVVDEKIVAKTKAAWNVCRQNSDIRNWEHP